MAVISTQDVQEAEDTGLGAAVRALQELLDR